MGRAEAEMTAIATDDASDATVDVGRDRRQVFDQFDEVIIVRRELSPVASDPDELQSPDCRFHSPREAKFLLASYCKRTRQRPIVASITHMHGECRPSVIVVFCIPHIPLAHAAPSLRRR